VLGDGATFDVWQLDRRHGAARGQIAELDGGRQNLVGPLPALPPRLTAPGVHGCVTAEHYWPAAMRVDGQVNRFLGFSVGVLTDHARSVRRRRNRLLNSPCTTVSWASDYSAAKWSPIERLVQPKASITAFID